MEQNNFITGTLSTQTSAANFALGADHGGFELKEALKQLLQQRGLTVLDFGAKTMDPADDYPDFAGPAAMAVGDGRAEFGLLVCTSGVGICITANKVAGVRAGVAEDEHEAAVMRQHNDVNVLCLSGEKLSLEAAQTILDSFIRAKFEGGRHERRVLKMDAKFAPANLRLKNVDPEIATVIERERQRQQENI